jgi:predicted Zn-dependent protease
MVEKINRIIPRGRTFIAALIVLLGLFKAESVSAGGITLISDVETQNYLSQIVRPLFTAAGFTFNENNILIVNDNSLNAFVSDGNYLFVNTGTILAIDDTNELAGILAHETGHIMGGHIVRQKLKLENMQYIMLGSMIAAGATAVSTGRGDAAVAVILGSQSSALNNLLNYQIQEERSADESAVKLLAQTKQSTDGLKRFMSKIKKQNALSGITESDYFRTHPLTNERVNHFAEACKNNKFPAKNPLDNKLAFIKAKLTAFLEEPTKVRRMYPQNKNDAPSIYAQAILNFRDGKITPAIQKIDELIKQQPDNPYFLELKGQFLFESGQIKESITVYRAALKLLPDTPDIQICLAQAMLENAPTGTEINEIITILQQALIKHKNATGWQLLARAYNMAGNKAAAYYATAEFNYAIGSISSAKTQLEKAKKEKATSALRLKIDDLDERLKAELR